MQVKRIGAVAHGDGGELSRARESTGQQAEPRAVAPLATGSLLPPANPRLALVPPAEKPAHNTPPPAPFQPELRAGMMREMQRASGHSFLALVKLQREFIANKAIAADLSIGAYMRKLADEEGYGATTPTRWPALSPQEQQAYRDRFAAVLEDFRAKAPAKLVRVIDEAEKAGGGMLFEPAECEKYGAYAYADGPTLGTGLSFLRDAESDITSIYSNVEHELNGHWKYGKTVSMDIIDAILVSLPEAERKRATDGEAELSSVYGYPETEVYAEMHEMEFFSWASNTDNPNRDIPAKLRDLQARFAPEVAAAIVRGFRYRMHRDESVTQGARDALDHHIRTVFGFTFEGENNAGIR